MSEYAGNQGNRETLRCPRLCHIVHGPHNDDFHNLWNQLRNEHEQLARKGYTGEGFLSPGRKLGGTRIPMQEARRRARAAAENRQALAAGSGQKLGGAPVRRGEDIRKVIADAATRRSMVIRGCASGTERERGIVEETAKNGFRTKAEEDDANEEAITQAYIELIQEEEREKYGKDYVAPSSTNPAGSKGDSKMASAMSETITPFAARRPLSVAEPPSAEPSDGWSCAVCTLYNPCGYLCCGACGCERSSLSTCPSIHIPTSHSMLSSASRHPTPIQRNSIEAIQSNRPIGWLCHVCGTFMESKWWTCSSCGCMKLSS